MILKRDLHQYMEHHKQWIDEKLTNHLQKLPIPDSLKQSMLYSLQAGGKRIRPILLIASHEAYNYEPKKLYSTIIALEMIHTYSLIHDDLPAMDDDDYRRGKLTNHKVFNEATAILAGDALLTYSFEIIATDESLSASEKVYLLKMLAKKSGPKGMIAGQILDLEAENQDISLEHLENIHRLKTGQLFKFPILAGAFLGQATEEERSSLATFAHYLGLVFQIQDDILDITGDEEKIGKPIGSDEANQKNTYPKLLGIEGAKQKRAHYVEKAKHSLSQTSRTHSRLSDFITYLIHRDH